MCLIKTRVRKNKTFDLKIFFRATSYCVPRRGRKIRKKFSRRRYFLCNNNIRVRSIILSYYIAIGIIRIRPRLKYLRCNGYQSSLPILTCRNPVKIGSAVSKISQYKYISYKRVFC